MPFDVNRFSSDLRSMTAWVQNIPVTLIDEGSRLVERTTVNASHDMWQRVNRIDTGLMKASVGVTDLKVDRNGAQQEFGWATPGARVEKYFLYQENGFKNVSPMHALLNSFIVAREKYYRDVDQLVKKALK